jgi:hypothetical protein
MSGLPAVRELSRGGFQNFRDEAAQTLVMVTQADLDQFFET